MKLDDIHYGLLLVLGIVAWFGMCLFHAIAWCGHQEPELPTKAAIKAAIIYEKHRSSVTDVVATDKNPTQWSDWLALTVVANIGALLVYVWIKRSQHNARKDVAQLQVRLDDNFVNFANQSSTLELETVKGFADTNQHLQSVRLTQAEIVDLIKQIIEYRPQISQPQMGIESVTSSNLTACQQQSNVERTLFYLQQICELFRQRNRARSARSTLSLERRRSMRSLRSEKIIKHISRHLFQPIRTRYNNLHLKREQMLRDSRLSADLQQQEQLQLPPRVRRSVSTTANGDGKHITMRKEAVVDGQRMIDIRYRLKFSSERQRPQIATP